jgi:hypothetical protein
MTEFKFAKQNVERFAGLAGSASADDVSNFQFFEQSDPTGLTGTVKAYTDPMPTDPFASLGRSSPAPSPLRFDAGVSKAEAGDVIDGFTFAPGTIKKTAPAVRCDPFPSSESSTEELYTSQMFKSFLLNFDPDAEDEAPPLRKREKFAVGMNVVLLSDGQRRKMKLTKVIPLTRNSNFFVVNGDWADESGSVRGIFSSAELAIAA